MEKYNNKDKKRITVLKISDYYLTSVLGEGAFGKVYKAINIKTKKQFAAKTIRIQPILSNPRKLELLKNELKIMKKLRHPNIVRLKRVIRTNENLYFITELCDGENLDSFIKNYKKIFNVPPSMRIIHHFICQIVKGICYMHLNNVIHRDIKLENIMLSFDKEEYHNDTFNTISDEIFAKSSIFNIVEDEAFRYNYFYYNYIKDKEKFDDIIMTSKIKIIDLGFSRILDNNGIASTFCGSPITMAPEIWTIKLGNNKKVLNYNNKIDMWSLGAMTYNLLTGYPPFIGQNIQDIFKKIEEGFYSLPNKIELSLEVIDFINGLLQFDPENRFSWVNIKNHPFIVKKYQAQIKLNIKKLENPKYNSINQLELNVFTRKNFLWENFELENEQTELDKILEKANLEIQEDLNKDNNYIENSSMESDDSMENIFDDIIKISIVEEDLGEEKQFEGFLVLSLNQRNFKN